MTTTLSAAERETFFAAIARHRRASWRVTAACTAAVVVLALTVAMLLAPLLYCMAGLVLDVVNLVTPAPDLMGWLGRQLDPLFSARNVPAASLVRAGAVAAAPGLVLMAVATSGLRRLWATSPLFDAGDLAGRSPDRTVLDEERLSNVVEEMAIAVGIAVPRIVIVPGGVNAAACGRDERHVTLLVGEGFIGAMGRDPLEGAIAHLIGSIADGDMTIGLRVTTVLALFGLMTRVGGALTDRDAFRQERQIWRVFVAPTAASTAAFLGELADPFHTPEQDDERTARVGGKSLTWREWLLMPLMGPVFLTGFLSGLVTSFLLEPLISLAWRQRKYMADATAVQLTRNPDALAAALVTIADSPTGLQPWAAHLAVAANTGSMGPFGRSIVPIFPSIEKRGAALVRMGAHVAPAGRPGMPWPAVAVLAALFSIVAALLALVVYLLVILSAALAGLFTIVPAAILHALLRSIGRV